MSTLKLDGFKAEVEYDPELKQFRGEILGLNGSADFYGNSQKALRREFLCSLKVFKEVCRENNIPPFQS